MNEILGGYLFMKTETPSFNTAKGETNAYVAVPDEKTEKAVIIVQEYWGLNEHVKDVVNRYAGEGFIGIAPDLFRGKLAANSDEASKMMKALSIEDGLE